MSEFIGSRISLISKSDIRYVGTLHEINSESSTVALEQVKSYGTEGRRGGEDEVAASEVLYEYIVFRGSDVKDLRIEEPPKENQPPAPPQVPNDPAILGSGTRPQSHSQSQRAQQGFMPGPAQPNHFQQPPYPPFQQPLPPFQNQRFGQAHGFPGPPGGFMGYPPGHFGGGPPGGWYPPPGQGFGGPHGPPGAFSPQNPSTMPFDGMRRPQDHSFMNGPQEVQNPIVQTELSGSSSTPAPNPNSAKTEIEKEAPDASAKDTEKDLISLAPSPEDSAPPPPNDTKPNVAAALAPSAPVSTVAAKVASNGNKNPNKSGRIMPAIPNITPLPAKATNKVSAQPSVPSTDSGTQSKGSRATADAVLQYQSATQAATAAVAAAMAKLPLAASVQPSVQSRHNASHPQIDGSNLDNLSQRLNDMRVDSNRRSSTSRGSQRGSHRGGPRGGHGRTMIEVPKTDFDFESANAKFNKQDLMKEAIATGAPSASSKISNGDTGTVTNGSTAGDGAKDVVIPAATSMYNKSSFFDNISSEAKDRVEAADAGGRQGGREFRAEERKKNFETFGQGSVESGIYRGRGRGRGRGGFRGGRARGGPHGGGYRGRGDAFVGAPTTEASQQ